MIFFNTGAAAASGALPAALALIKPRQQQDNMCWFCSANSSSSSWRISKQWQH
jgi:hypothetical protein